jgi:hypothetical protein
MHKEGIDMPFSGWRLLQILGLTLFYADNIPGTALLAHQVKSAQVDEIKPVG